MNYTAINGNPFDIEMQANISPGQDRVTTVAGQSGEETSVANRSGSAVSWSFSGSNTVTEVTLHVGSLNRGGVNRQHVSHHHRHGYAFTPTFSSPAAEEHENFIAAPDRQGLCGR